MKLLSYLFPQLVFRTSSPFNNDIRILEERGRNKLLVNGSRQSGAYIAELWRRAFEALNIVPDTSVRSILVLGVGGGTVIHLLRQMYPQAKITGVDIDETMLAIGRTYFGLAGMRRLTLIHQDAKEYARKAAAQRKRYDLVIVDLFFGRDIPAFVASPQFLHGLKKIVTKNGSISINYLRELEYGTKSDMLMRALKKTFPTVADFGIYHNRFFAAK